MAARLAAWARGEFAVGGCGGPGKKAPDKTVGKAIESSLKAEGKDAQVKVDSASGAMSIKTKKDGEDVNVKVNTGDASASYTEKYEVNAAVSARYGVDESDIENVEIDGNTATATLSSGEEIPLSLNGGQWVPTADAPDVSAPDAPQASAPQVEQPQMQQPQVQAPSAPSAPSP